MKFGPQRGHIACIFDNFFKDFGLMIVALLVSLVTGDVDLLLENIGLLVVVLVAPVWKVLAYLTTTYAVDDEKLIIKSGIMTKNSLEVPLSTITTVDISQNVFHQIFHVYKLNIDNNSNISSDETKIAMTLKQSDADAVRVLLMKGRQGLDGSNFAGEHQGEEEVKEAKEKTEVGTRYDIKVADLLMMGLMKSKLVFLFELLGVIAVIANLLPIKMVDETTLDSFVLVVKNLGVTPVVLICLAVLFIISAVCGMVGSFIKYYGFKVLDNGEAVKIEYGLFNHKTYTIAKKKISGIYFEQSPLMRVAKRGILKLMAVGYGSGNSEETSEEAILFPFLREREMREVICRILPELEAVENYNKPEQKALRYFFVRFSVLFATVCLIGCLFLPRVHDFFQGAWILGVLYLLFGIAVSVIDYLTTGAYGNHQHFSFCHGGCKKVTIFVKTSMIESMEADGSIWKGKRGITDITIGCLAPRGESVQIVKNLPVKTFETLKSYLIY